MTFSAEFHGGPAAGWAVPGLGRCPTFVRVVQTKDGKKLDVLNDLDDEPRADEDVVGVYLKRNAAPVYVCRSGPATGAWIHYEHLPIIGARYLRSEDAWIERMAQIVGCPADLVREQRAAERGGAPAGDPVLPGGGNA